jgi:predicted transcriptional regulator
MSEQDLSQPDHRKIVETTASSSSEELTDSQKRGLSLIHQISSLQSQNLLLVERVKELSEALKNIIELKVAWEYTRSENSVVLISQIACAALKGDSLKEKE